MKSDYFEFSDEELSVVEDYSERVEAPPTLLDLTGVTSHEKKKDWERDNWNQSQRIASLLSRGGEFDLASELATCHCFQTVRRCHGCSDVQMFWNRCDKMICPQCAPRITRNRLDGLMWFVEKMKQPKHVVLTFKNVPVLTREYLRDCLKVLQRLRRQKIARTWTAGMWAMEITNKGNGWHVHYHLLVESSWFSQKELSVCWKFLTNHESFVVHVSDAGREGIKKNLPRYVASYTTKGTNLASWSSEMLCEFVAALRGCRTFGVFGTLFAARAEFRLWMNETRAAKRFCGCGCQWFRYFSEKEFAWFVETKDGPIKPVVSFHSKNEPELALNFHNYWQLSALAR